MPAERGPRVLVEPSDYTFHNLGDVAMLQSAVTRLKDVWPAAELTVLTDDEEGLATHLPTVRPLLRTVAVPPVPPTAGLRRRSGAGLLTDVRSHAVRTMRSMRRPRDEPDRLRQQLMTAVEQSDLLVVAGMGGLTDWFEDYALGLLDTVAIAIGLDRPTALMGQGIGPITAPNLRARARSVLPKVDLIALREDQLGGPLLRDLGVAPEHVVTTGDDAVELAWARRPASTGGGLGVNVRVGWYSCIDEGALDPIRDAVTSAGLRAGAALVSVPISRTPGEQDAIAFRRIADGYPQAVDEAESLRTPVEVVRRVGSCRVMVAGSYHAAVFALAQGIPTIGLVGSSYYAAKFEGLAALFGEGALALAVDGPFEAELAAAIDRFWRSAEQLRPGLLAAAERQVTASRAAWRSLPAIVAGRSRGASPFAS